jgi:hypothetical protein
MLYYVIAICKPLLFYFFYFFYFYFKKKIIKTWVKIGWQHWNQNKRCIGTNDMNYVCV